MKQDPELVNRIDSIGNTVVHLMAIQGFDGCIKDIIDQYPTLSLTANQYTQYPIHLSILNNQIESFKLLLKMRGAAHLTDSRQRTCLHDAALFRDESYLALCLEAGANIEAHDTEQMTPLLLAAQKGNFLNVKYLILSGANLEAIDGKGRSLIHFGVLSENMALITWLLDDLNIDVNIEDGFKHTPFFYLRQ